MSFFGHLAKADWPQRGCLFEASVFRDSSSLHGGNSAEATFPSSTRLQPQLREAKSSEADVQERRQASEKELQLPGVWFQFLLEAIRIPLSSSRHSVLVANCPFLLKSV